MKRFHSFLNSIQIPGVKKDKAVLQCNADEALLWFNGRMYSKKMQIGFDTRSERFFLLTTPTHESLAPAHLLTIACIKEGKVADVAATRSFITLWLQQITNGSRNWTNLLSGTYIVPTQLTESQIQMYEQVFQGINGKWEEKRIGAFLPYLITEEKNIQSCGTVLYLAHDYLEINIISGSQVIKTRTRDLGLKELLFGIDQVLRENYRIVTDETTLRQIYEIFAHSKTLASEKRISIRGKDLSTSLPQNTVVELSQFTNLINSWLNEILLEIKLVYSQLSTSELSLLQQDVAVIGRGASFQPLEVFLKDALNVMVSVPSEPERSIFKVLKYAI